jgi:A/G-specific adenine glycosylase
MIEEPDADPSWRGRMRRGLAAWYARGHRDLPWRRDRDPYRILVSETMLVQTTVAAAAPYFERFLARFPTVNALAQADEADVLKAWEGLGYYRRARQLHEAARAIVNNHGGLVPDDPARLRALPGVGRYIAGAVLSFAFDQPAAVVEANTQRVLARLLAWDEDIAKTKSQNRLWQAAERLVPEVGAGEFNQALMELGATTCTPRDPSCLICPIAAECRARTLGLQDRLPIKVPKAAPLEVVEACALVRRDKCLLVVQRGPGGLWDGFWEFPTIHVSGADPAGRSPGRPEDLAHGVRRLTGVRITDVGFIHAVKFGVTKYRMTLNIHSATDLGELVIPDSGLMGARFVTSDEIAGLVMGSGVRKVARWAAVNVLGEG